MEPCAALVGAPELYRLLASLERQGGQIEDETPAPKAFEGLIVERSREDPGERVGYLVPSEVPSGAAALRDRWLAEHRAEIAVAVKDHKLSRCTIVVPGEEPSAPLRARIEGCAVRVVSATYHLWADRLRIFDEQGGLDPGACETFLERLGPRWSDEDEKRYTEAALTPVAEEDKAAAQARQMMIKTSPDLPAGAITLVFGPGGIGKTYFLRRLGHQLRRGARQDLTMPVPVFAELPVLLHGAALENWLESRGVRLPNDQIRTLIGHGVIVPMLDALDELVR